MDEIEVWHVDLDAPAPPVLSPDEHRRAGRYARGDDGRRWAAARAALRVLLGARVGLHAREVTFEHGPHGKPHVAGGPCFNLSHAGGIALVALAGAREVGVDVERTDRRSHAIRRALTGSERRALGELPGHHELMRIWCRKEALAKATGGGLRWAPERFDTTAADGYALADLDIATGYVAALAVEGDAPYSISARRVSSAARRRQSPESYLNEIPSRTRKFTTPPSPIVTSWRTTSATRRSRTVLAAVSTATRAAASHDSLLTPMTSVTRYTLSAMGLSSVGSGSVPNGKGSRCDSAAPTASWWTA